LDHAGPDEELHVVLAAFHEVLNEHLERCPISCDSSQAADPDVDLAALRDGCNSCRYSAIVGTVTDISSEDDGVIGGFMCRKDVVLAGEFHGLQERVDLTEQALCGGLHLAVSGIGLDWSRCSAEGDGVAFCD